MEYRKDDSTQITTRHSCTSAWSKLVFCVNKLFVCCDQDKARSAKLVWERYKKLLLFCMKESGWIYSLILSYISLSGSCLLLSLFSRTSSIFQSAAWCFTNKLCCLESWILFWALAKRLREAFLSETRFLSWRIQCLSTPKYFLVCPANSEHIPMHNASSSVLCRDKNSPLKKKTSKIKRLQSQM